MEYTYVIKRLIMVIPIIVCTTVITFVVVHSVPGDPVEMFLTGGMGGSVSPEVVEQMRQKLGLDKPLYVQYLIYLQNLLSGNLGYSIYFHRPVLEDFVRFLPATIELAIVAMVFTVALGIPLGVISATRRNTWVDHIIRVVSMFGVGMPVFWLAIMLQIFFYGQLNVLPIGGRIDPTISLRSITGLHILDSLLTFNWTALQSSIIHIILPATALSFEAVANMAKMTRSTILEVLEADYVRTARASGFSETTILFKYALKNALIPNLTIMGLAIGVFMQGSFMVESIFRWPGIGFYTMQTIFFLDYMPIVNVTLLMTVTYVLVNLIIDMLYTVVDPRIKT